MENKIIEAKFKKSPLFWVIIAVGLIAIIGGCLISYNDYLTGTHSVYHPFTGYVQVPNTEHYSSFARYFILHIDPVAFVHMHMVYGGVLVSLLGLFFAWMMNSCSMTITSNQVTGKASFGKIVDLPISQISAVSLGIFNSITVATSSGKIHFWLLKNRAEVHDELNKTIGKVQIDAAHQHNSTTPASNTDELKKFKELLDAGVITQEEFDAKKKQLLGL